MEKPFLKANATFPHGGMNPPAFDGDCLPRREQLNATGRIFPLGNKWMRSS